MLSRVDTRPSWSRGRLLAGRQSVGRILTIVMCMVIFSSYLGLSSAANASVGDVPMPGPVIGQTENFDPTRYSEYVKATAATRREKDQLSDLASAARSSGDWTAFDAQANARDRRLGASAGLKPIDHTVTGGQPTSKIAPATVWGTFHFVAGATQFAQITGYYCGPAAGQSILAGWAYAGWSFAYGTPNQDGLANLMGTTSSSGTGIYEWARGMNGWIWNNKDMPGGWIYKAASTQTTMVNDIRGNIDANWGAGVNTVELTGGWRYNSHPSGGTIRHFISAFGYDTSANNLNLTDSAANSPAFNWPNVQPTVAMTNAFLFNFINQSGSDKRGYSY